MEICNRIEDYFANVLQEEEKVAFKRHLATCSLCPTRLDQLAFLDKELRKVMPQSLRDEKPRSGWVEDIIRRMQSHN